MKNIYLIGMPGCGKSTIGKQVSVIEKLDFVDLDLYTETKTGMTVEEMFLKGEEFFRYYESRCLGEISLMTDTIVATGGGIVTIAENVELIKKTGTVIFIDTEPDMILANCTLSGRPLIKEKSRIYDLYSQRISLYRGAADHTVTNNGFLSDACDEVQRIIKAKR